MGKKKSQKRRGGQASREHAQRTNAAKARRVERNQGEQRHAANPNGKPPDLSGLMKGLKSLGDKLKEEQARREKLGITDPKPDVVNNHHTTNIGSVNVVGAQGKLPKPNRMVVELTHVRWEWITIEDSCSVYAYAYTDDYILDGKLVHAKGDYVVSVQQVYTAENYTPDEAKLFGEALISSWQWQFVWEQFAGEYIANGGWMPVDPPERDGEETPVEIHDEANGLDPMFSGLRVIEDDNVPVGQPVIINEEALRARSEMDSDDPVVSDDPRCTCPLQIPAPPNPECPIHGELFDTDGNVAQLAPPGMDPEWCLGGGAEGESLQNRRGDFADCALCGRRLKVLKNGRFSPHKKVVKK